MSLGVDMHRFDQPVLEVRRHNRVSLCRAALPDHLAGPSFRDPMTMLQIAHGSPAASRAQ
jgi:hypothetical protein